MNLSIESITGWVRDVRLTRRGLLHKETGHRIPLDPATLGDMLRWVSYDRAMRNLPTVQDQPIKVCFTPTRARPWYFARSIVDHLGAEIVDSPNDADLIWAFEDATHSAPLIAPATKITINAGTTDISKSRIGEVMEDVFGYSLSVDPEVYRGPMVSKSEINGAHDGHVVEGPTSRQGDQVYQVLVDNRVDEDAVEDLRTTIMGGRPVLVFRKRRGLSDRFANANSSVLLATLDSVYSPEEVEKIAAFAQAIRLDAGGLDVLRDRATGNLYIVDANKTDMGPPLALPLAHKLAATRMMAQALAETIEREHSLRPIGLPPRPDAHANPRPLIKVPA